MVDLYLQSQSLVLSWFGRDHMVDLYLQSQSLVLSRFGRDHMVDLYLQSQSLLIFTSSIPAHGEVYCIQPSDSQHKLIKILFSLDPPSFLHK